MAHVSHSVSAGQHWPRVLYLPQLPHGSFTGYKLELSSLSEDSFYVLALTCSCGTWPGEEA